MARADGDMDFSGSLGNFVFYKVNGKMFVRKKRSKMTKGQKEKKSFQGSQRIMTKSQRGIQFGTSLRRGIRFKVMGYSYLHSRMNKFIFKEIIARDIVNGRDELTILAEHLHHMDKLVTNDEFPPKLFDVLRKTQLRLTDTELVIDVPAMPIELLGKRVDGYSIWVDAKFISLADYGVTLHKVDRGERVSELEKKIFTFQFDVPPKTEGEILAVAIGLNSFKGDAEVEGDDVNGFLWKILV